MILMVYHSQYESFFVGNLNQDKVLTKWFPTFIVNPSPPEGLLKRHVKALPQFCPVTKHIAFSSKSIMLSIPKKFNFNYWDEMNYVFHADSRKWKVVL